MEWLERLSLYRNEDELKKDAEGLRITYRTATFDEFNERKNVDCFTDEFMDDMLYYAMRQEEPWRGLISPAIDIKAIFYSNALACALLTFNYLAADNVPFEQLVCDPLYNETTKNNIGLKEKIKQMEERKERILAEEDENKRIAEDYPRTIYPCRYIPNEAEAKDFLAPIILEMVYDLTDNDSADTIDRILYNMRNLYIDYQSRKIGSEDGLLDGEKEDSS